MGNGPKCEGCTLHKTGAGFTEIEVGARYSATKLLLIGEASGEAEARESLPFRPYAQSGSLLTDAMREVNINRSEVAITNILRCRPPKDWLEGAPWQYNATMNCIKNYLYDAIQELQPRAILALGGTAFRALTAAPKGKYGTLDYARGYVMAGVGPAEGIPVIATYHPAHLRRGAPELTPLLQRDLRRAFLLATGKLIEGKHYALGLDTLELRYQTAPTIDEAWAWYRSIDPALPIAYDIETPKSVREDEDERTSFTDRDIKLFQVTQRRGEGIALPWREEFIEVARAIMAAPNLKIGHNSWAFDEPVLAHNQAPLAGEHDDTMTMFGFYWSDLPKNLQAAAQSCGFLFPWKAIGETDIAFYGCVDVDATLCVYESLRATLEREGLWESYRTYFCSLWPILRDAAARGIPIDEIRRQELKALIRREDLRVTAAIQALVPAEILSTKQKNGYKNPPLLECEECGLKTRTDHVCASGEEVGSLFVTSSDAEVTPYADLAAAHGLVLREVTIEGGDEKCRCSTKARPTCVVCHGTGIIPAGTVEMRWATPTEFNPNSHVQVKNFMKFTRHPIPKHAKRIDAEGEAADTTEVKELERLYTATKHPIYPLLIEKRQLTKMDGTYANGWKPDRDGRVHTTYTFQTATWQTSSRAPDVQNGPKHGKSEFQKSLVLSFNRMQRAESGHVLINFDFKSFHALTTAHDFNIPDYARLARIDIHSFVTCQFLKLPECVGLWERDDADMTALFKRLRQDERFKDVRDVPAKQTILGIQFGRGPTSIYTMYKEFFDSVAEAKVIWQLVYDLFPRLRVAQDEVKALAADEHRLVNKFGAIRHFYDVQRWDRRMQKFVAGDQAEQAVAFLPASHAFGYVRDVLLRIRARSWDERFGLINSIHDSLVFHCPIELRDECIALVKAEMEKPSPVLVYPSMAPNGLWVGADASYGECLAEIK